MISRIGPLVQGTRNRTSLILHVVGGLVGGGFTGLILGLLGTALGELFLGRVDSLELLIPALVLIPAGLSDLGAVGFLRVTPTRQTPSWFPCAFGESPGVFLWGMDLGLGAATRIPYQTFLAVGTFALFSGDFLLSVLVMSLYGGSRAATVTTSILGARGRFDEVCTRLSVRKTPASALVGMIALFLAFSLIGSV